MLPTTQKNEKRNLKIAAPHICNFHFSFFVFFARQHRSLVLIAPHSRFNRGLDPARRPVVRTRRTHRTHRSRSRGIRQDEKREKSEAEKRRGEMEAGKRKEADQQGPE